MEIFPRSRQCVGENGRLQLNELEERALQALRRIGPNAWSLYFAIQKRLQLRGCRHAQHHTNGTSNSGDSDVPNGGVGLRAEVDGAESQSQRRYYVDNVQEPVLFAEHFPIQDTASDPEVKAKRDAGQSTPSVHYIHVTLCASPEASEIDVTAALDKIEVLGVPNWSEKLLFPYLSSALCTEVERRCRQQGGTSVTEGWSRVLEWDPSYETQLSPLPAHMHLCDLRPCDAEIVNQNWKYGSCERTLDYVRGMIENSPPGWAVGVFANVQDHASCSTSTADGERQRRVQTADVSDQGLVAWGVVAPYGAIGLLQTIPEYQRQGLSQHVICRLCTGLASQSLVAFSCIEDDNEPSMRCFKKAGFHIVPDARVTWLHYFPPGKAVVDFINQDATGSSQPKIIGTCM